MNYQIKILILSFLTSLVVSLLVIPLLRRLKVGQIERDDGPESHLKKQGTPTMGGIIIMLGIIGEYLWRNFDETRKRPNYVIDEKRGFDDDRF